jgi:hypothetical protein
LIAAGCGEKAEDSANAAKAADSARVADSTRMADSVKAAQADSASKAQAAAANTAKPAKPRTEHVVKVHEATAGLLAKAKVQPIDAQHMAQTKYPMGVVKDGQILYRSGDLVYAFNIQQEGVTGTEEVFVSAMNGTLITAIHREPAPKAVAKKPAAKKPTH